MNNCVFWGKMAVEPIKQRIIKGDKETLVVNFNIAVMREYWGGKNMKDFLPCVAYGRVAELIAENFTVGSNMLIHCRAQSVAYIQNSKTIRAVQFVVDRSYFVDPKGFATNVDADPEPMDEIYIPPNYSKLEEIEEPSTITVDEKPKKRSKKSEG